MEQNKNKSKRKYQQSRDIQNRDIRITIRLTNAEYSEIDRAHIESKYSKLSDYIRYKLLVGGQLSKTKSKQEFYEKVIYEINKIGVNVNQITKIVNQNKSISGQANVALLESYLSKLLDKLDIILES